MIRRIGVNEDIVLMGGVGYNTGFKNAMQRELGVEIFIPEQPEYGMAKNRGVIERLMPKIHLEAAKTKWDTQIAGAVGAALFGYELCQKGKGRKK